MPKMKIYWSRIIGVAVGVLALTGWSGFVVGRLMLDSQRRDEERTLQVVIQTLSQDNQALQERVRELEEASRLHSGWYLHSKNAPKQGELDWVEEFAREWQLSPKGNAEPLLNEEQKYAKALGIIRGRQISDYEKARTLLSDINVDSEKYNDAQAYLKWLQVDQLVRDASAFAEEDDHESAVELMKVARELDGGDKAGADVKRLLKKFTSERDMSCGSASTLESDQATAKNKPIKDSHAMSQATKDALIKSSGISLEEAQRRLRVK